MTPERVLLCVDDAARRRELAAALDWAESLRTVGSCRADESSARAAAARQPDVVLVAAARPGVEGAKLVGRLRALSPRAGVLALAEADDRPRTVLARSLVADRYVDPATPAAQVVELLAAFARERRAGRAAS